MLKGTPVLLGMKNAILTENWTLTGESVNFAKNAVLNDIPPDFVRVVTVSAIQKKDSVQRYRYVKANIVQYTASQTRVKPSWLHKTTEQEDWQMLELEPLSIVNQEFM